MTIKINLTRSDLFLGQISLNLRSKSNWLIAGIFGIAIFYDQIKRLGSSGEITCSFCSVFASFVVAIAFVCLVFIPLVLFILILNTLFAGRSKGVLCLHEFVLNDDGLLEKTDVNESLTKWSGVQSIKKTRKHIFIHIGEGTHILPKREFADKIQFEEFWQILVDYWNEYSGK